MQTAPKTTATTATMAMASRKAQPCTKRLQRPYCPMQRNLRRKGAPPPALAASEGIWPI